MTTIRVNASKSYDVEISYDILNKTGEKIKNMYGVKTIAVITDNTVDKLYSTILLNSLENQGHKVYKFVFNDGENSKSAETYIEILNFLSKNKLTRSDIVIALGGGIPGDIAGFAAATYLRGIKFIQIPTTLLACVDSSVGGKTAINLSEGKNLAGAFYQPDLVLCDYKLLETLPLNIYSDGIAEVIKYGVIADIGLFELLENYSIKEYIEPVISKCVSIKSNIVNSDEHDNGIRQLLNFGHTFGHAIEKASNYKISHGSAVSIGMVIASKAAFKLGLSENNCTERIVNVLMKYNLPYECPYNSQELINAALSDKKRQGDKLNIVVPKTIGECYLHTIEVNELKKYIEAGL